MLPLYTRSANSTQVDNTHGTWICTNAVWLFRTLGLPTTAICLVSLLPLVNLVFFWTMQLLARPVL